MLKWSIFFVFINIAIILSSCFKEDVRVPAHKQLYPQDSIVNSIYLFESYFSLDSASVLKFNPVNAWDMAFECGTTDWHILVNAGGNKQIANTGKYSFQDVTPAFPVSLWKFDASSGNLDSTAIGKWVDTTTLPFQYTGEIYIVGNYNNTTGNFTPYRKVKFTSVTDSLYQIIYSDFSGGPIDTSIVHKNPAVNFVYFSFSQPHATLNLEPDKNTWDMKFGPYKTLVPAPDGTPTPYPVRGVLTNRNKVQSAKDSSIIFDLLAYSDISKFDFSGRLDVIGYDWKVYNFTSQTYFIDPSVHYLIQSVKGNYFKLRFTEFYKKNPTSQEGYPKFDFVKLTP